MDRGPRKSPPCEDAARYRDCFALFKSTGKCVALDRTGFGERGCPFYKTMAQREKELGIQTKARTRRHRMKIERYLHDQEETV